MDKKQVSKTMQINVCDILNLLPHRYPFLLIDKVEDVQYHERILAIKNVTFNEPFFAGHFPGHPVMPGVLLIEAMAQAAVILCNLSFKKDLEDSGAKYDKSNNIFYLATIEKASFKHRVIPGDSVVLEVKKLSSKLGMWKMQGVATVGNTCVAECTFMAALAQEDMKNEHTKY